MAGSRAQAILRPILLRRTKNSTLDGEPLLQLPAKEIEIVKLQFTQEERDVSNHFIPPARTIPGLLQLRSMIFLREKRN